LSGRPLAAELDMLKIAVSGGHTHEIQIEILKSQFITTKLSHFEQRQCYLIDPPFKNAAWHYKRDSQPPISDPVFSSP